MSVCPSLICDIIALQYRYYYPDLSLLKALGRPEGSIPSSVCMVSSPRIHVTYALFPFRLQIVVESFVALFLGIIGACLKAPPLKEITWASEMKTRCAFTHVPFYALSSYIASASSPPLSVFIGRSTIWTREWDLRISIREEKCWVKKRHQVYDIIESPCTVVSFRECDSNLCACRLRPLIYRFHSVFNFSGPLIQ